MSVPVTDNRPQVPRWVYLAEAAMPVDEPPLTMPGAARSGIGATAAESLPGRPRRLDLLLLLGLMAAVILGLCVVYGTGPART